MALKQMKKIDDLRIASNEKKAIEEASRILKEKYSIQKVIVFGSKARGDDDIESDIDLLILSTTPILWQERKSIINTLYEIQLKHDVIISPLIATVHDWDNGTFSVLPIHEEVASYGVLA